MNEKRIFKICKHCGKEFECYPKKVNRTRTKYLRPINAINCSKNCSKLYYWDTRKPK